MKLPRQTLGSPAAALVLGIALTACSTISSDAQGGLDGDSVGDGGSSDDSPGSDAGDGDGDGDGDSESNDDGDDESDGVGDEGPEDPRMSAHSCSPSEGLLLTYDLADANQQIAPALVRESVLGSGRGVPPIPLSPRPFLNHYAFDYPPGDASEPKISGELWTAQGFSESLDSFRLQFAVSGPQMSNQQRPPVDLAIVVDLGPSMVGEPLVLAQDAIEAIEAGLQLGDHVSLIAAGDQPLLLTEGTVGDGDAPTLAASLSTAGDAAYSSMPAALELAYELLDEAEYEENEPDQSRVLLLSTGHFAFDDELLELVDEHADDGQFLVSVGLGDPLTFAEPAFRSLAEHGRGTAVYARNAEELWAYLHDGFAKHLLVTAVDVEVQLDLPPGLALSERDPGFGGVPDSSTRAVLGPNDALVFHHRLEVCGELDPEAAVVVELEWTDPSTGAVQQSSWEWPLAEHSDGSLALRKGAAVTAYVQALVAHRDSSNPMESYAAVINAIELIAEAIAAMPGDADLIEMSEVLASLENLEEG